MTELHLHLDGSLSPEFILKQAQKDGVPLPAGTVSSLEPCLTVGDSCGSLSEYLEKFELPLSVLQTEDAIEQGVYHLMAGLAKEGLHFAEIRFAPQLHLTRGLTQEGVVQAALSGLKSACRDFPIDGNLILCCMRMADNQAANETTLDIAARCLSSGVAGLDLAGAEALFPTRSFENLFRKASAKDIPFTIHAGEAAGPESIWAALRFGAMRIGHGIRCMEDPSLLEELVKRQIPLEVCPTSNVQTKACGSLSEHPVLKLLDYGIRVTVNTDNRTVSNTNLKKEFELLRSRLHMTDAQEMRLLENAEHSLLKNM